jgi:hypothetical protein
MKQSRIVITLTMAFSIMLIAVGPLGSVSAQQQQSTPFDAVANTTGGGAGGNATGGGAGGNATGGAAAAEPEIGTASELENLTQGNPEALTNNTEVTDPTTGLGDLQKEQTSTDPNMTTPSG